MSKSIPLYRRIVPFFPLLALLLFVAPEGRAELFPYPTFTDDREFVVLAPREFVRMPEVSRFSVLFLQAALKTCPTSVNDAGQVLESMLQPGLPVFKAIEKLSPEAPYKILSRPIAILIDDFGPKREIFRSYYLKDVPEKDQFVVGLDCGRSSVDYWGPSLAHEFAHLAILDTGRPSSIDELLTQLVEVEAGGRQPELALEQQQGAQMLAPLIETARPLPSRAHYASAYLFGKYLLEHQGGWKTIQALLELKETNLDTIAAAINELKESRVIQTAFKKPLDGKSLLLHFAIAASLGHPKYRIGSWRGLSVINEVKGDLILQPTQYINVAIRNSMIPYNSELDMYQICQTSERFEVYDAKSNSGCDGQRQYLIINSGNHPLRVFD